MGHLQEYNVSYFAHMRRALGFFIKSFVWTCEVFTHAFIPDLFTNTSEKMKAEIKRLEDSC
jgi:hypothetical protein